MKGRDYKRTCDLVKELEAERDDQKEVIRGTSRRTEILCRYQWKQETGTV